MLKSRIEVNDQGEFVIKVPEDVVDTHNLDEGDILEWDYEEGDLIILSVA